MIVDIVLVTAKDLSSILKISKWKIYEMTKQEMLPHVKFGRAIRYNPSRVIEFLNTK